MFKKYYVPKEAIFQLNVKVALFVPMTLRKLFSLDQCFKNGDSRYLLEDSQISPCLHDQ